MNIIKVVMCIGTDIADIVCSGSENHRLYQALSVNTAEELLPKLDRYLPYVMKKCKQLVKLREQNGKFIAALVENTQRLVANTLEKPTDEIEALDKGDIDAVNEWFDKQRAALRSHKTFEHEAAEKRIKKLVDALYTIPYAMHYPIFGKENVMNYKDDPQHFILRADHTAKDQQSFYEQLDFFRHEITDYYNFDLKIHLDVLKRVQSNTDERNFFQVILKLGESVENALGLLLQRTRNDDTQHGLDHGPICIRRGTMWSLASGSSATSTLSLTSLMSG
jgi:hypothetical protein